jgi:hypothetical protein
MLRSSGGPRRRCAIALALAVCASSLSPRAHAGYSEYHPTAHDVHLTVDEAGRAVIDHAITYRVVAGAMKGFDIDGILPESTESDVGVTAEDGQKFLAHAGPVVATGAAAEPSARKLRVDVLEAKGLKRGVYVFHVKYRTDLVDTHALTRDGALWRLAWIAPPPPEGLDGFRVVLDLPAAATEPRPAGDSSEGGMVPTLRRGPERDELELVRPHVGRGEAVTWSARVDPRAFPAVKSPELRPPPAAPAPPPERASWLAIAALVALAVGFGFVANDKARRVARACAAAGTKPRVPIALPSVLRAVIAAALVAGGVALQASGSPTTGAVLVAVSMLFTTHLAPSARPRPRGPGAWLTQRASEAFARGQRGDALDATTRRGALTAVGVAALLVVLGFALRRFDPEAPGLVLLDALALVPIFFTGIARQLPPDAARAPIATLRAIYKRLRKDRALRVAPWARVPAGGAVADELRLLVVPRAPMPGVVGIEAGVAWRRTSAGFSASPEVLVRVLDATPAAARLTSIAPHARPVTGRRPEERVVRLVPTLPTRAAMRELVVAVARELVDRRMKIATKTSWRGDERRLPPSESEEPGALVQAR